MPFAALPDPAEAASLEDLVERLRLLKIWGGDPSYEIIKDRVNASWAAAGRPAGELTRRSTVANCFQTGRRRMNTDLVLAVVQALHPHEAYVTQWRQALRVIGGEIEAVSQVRVDGSLPQDLAEFTGRIEELDRLRDATRAGEAVVISAIEGMAGVGKTQLAVHAGHWLHRQEPFGRVLFVNLRGFHPDPGQPPADPAAVLDGFLRLLGVPGHQIPHDLPARTTLYRDRLAGHRTLVVLDNAATTEQVRPLLPETPGCLTLVTSRHSLAGLPAASHIAVDVFTPDEAVTFLTGAVPKTPTGDDPDAAARIAERCGHLPLALSLIAGHIRNTKGWTLTEHADRLDERHRDRRLESGVELALDLSYQHLPARQQRLLRLAALHPGQDLDAYAAAALAGTDLPTARAGLGDLRADHLLQETGPGRYTFHDLVRAYATTRAHDEDPPAERRAALTRLIDHYLATAAAAMDAVHPQEAHRRPRIPPAAGPAPDLTDPGTALAWLNAERPSLIAVTVHAATHGWHGHTALLGETLYRYFSGGHHTDALTMYGHALQAARDSGDLTAQARALGTLAFAHVRLGRPGVAIQQNQEALDLYRQTGDQLGQARALYALGVVTERSGRYPEAVNDLLQALTLYRQVRDETGEANALNALSLTMQHSGRLPEATDYCRQTLVLARRNGDRHGEANALHGLGDLETQSGRYEPAHDYLWNALLLWRQLGNRTGEMGVLDSLGMLLTRLGRPGEAIEYHEQALAIMREVGDQDSEAWALNSLGEATQLAGRPAEAITHHTASLVITAETDDRHQQARAHAGLGNAHLALGDPAEARARYEQALTLYTDLGVPEADEIRARLAALA